MANKWVLFGKVSSSSYRKKILLKLSEGVKTPKLLSRETGIKFSHISVVLKELKDLKLIKCLTPELRKGRMYGITKLGKDTLKLFSGSG